VAELANEGLDTVRSSVSYTLSANVENLVLTGVNSIDGTGNELNNSMTGNGSDNRLDGGAGVDTLTGGAGNDTYLVDNANDAVVENADEGTDTVYAGITYTLTANLENLVLAGGASINATGNALDNVLIGNRGANVLTGGAGDDTLDGRIGADTLIGGAGDDLYVVDNVGDVVTETAGQGTDTVEANISYSVASLANVENVTLTGNTAISATGNAADNRLIGNSAANVLDSDGGSDFLDGGLGADVMIGGSGDDTYVVDNAGDSITENAGGGNDSVISSISYSLASQANLENITLIDTADLSATGNAADNLLIGNIGDNALTGGAGNDTLDGWMGADTMTGGTGNDTYFVDNSADAVIESAGEGVDTVRSSLASYTLGANVENLTLAGSGNTSGTGNALDNTLLGNAGNNLLSADGGADTLTGGAGNDTLLGGTGNDLYTFDAGFGHDSITDNDAAGGNVDIIRFGAGIAPAQVTASRAGQNLVLTMGANDVTVQNWYASAADKVERVEFAGGTVWDVNTLRAMTNSAPSLDNAIADQNATEDAAFSFTVPVSTFSDADASSGDTLAYSATLSNGAALPSWLVFNAGTRTFSGTPLNADVGNIDVLVTATDAVGIAASDVFRITVANTNDAPTNIALSTNTVAENAANAVVGNLSTTDVDAGDAFTYSIQPGGNGAQFAIVGNQLRVGATGLDFEGGATRTVNVRSTDAAGAFFDKTLTVNVTNVNETPTDIALSTSTVAENAANAVVGNLSTSDVDAGDTFTYSIQPGGNGAQFVISGNQLKVGATGLDFEGGATRTVNVRSTDAAGAFFDKTLTVNVTNVNETPTDIALSTSTVAENAANAVVGNLSTTDVDAGDTFTYSIQPGGNGAQFVISGNQLKVGATGLDFEGGATRTVNVRSTDAAGAFFDKTLTVNVTNVNETPTDIALSTSTVAENAANAVVGNLSTTDVDAGDTFTYSIQSGGNGAQFAIVGNQLRVGATGLDFEGGATRTVNVRSTDAAGAFFDKTLTVNVTNVNETPTDIALSTSTVAENTANAVVGNLSTTDVDAGDTFTYSIQPGGNGAQFVISGNQLKVGATGLDYEAAATRSVTVRTTDAAGAFFDKTFTINVTNANDAPTLANAIADQNATEASAFSFTVPLNTFADVDAGDTLSYTASRADGSALPSWLAFNATTRTFSGTPLNGDVGALSLKVTATDAGGLSTSDTFDLTVQNMNTPPTDMALSANTVAENAANATVGTLSTTDADTGDAFTYSIQPGGNGSQFAIVGSQLRVGATGLDYEAGTTRTVTVRTTDSGGAFFDKLFTINVTNANDTPTNIALSGSTVAENAANAVVGTLSSTDQDAGDSFTYSIRPGGDGAQFAIVGNELRVGTTALDYEAGATRSVTVRTTDAAGAFFDKTLTVNVTNVNEAPTNIALGARHRGGERSERDGRHAEHHRRRCGRQLHLQHPAGRQRGGVRHRRERAQGRGCWSRLRGGRDAERHGAHDGCGRGVLRQDVHGQRHERQRDAHQYRALGQCGGGECGQRNGGHAFDHRSGRRRHLHLQHPAGGRRCAIHDFGQSAQGRRHSARL
jgi:Ca2+-binding RTX toxin-like protein